MALIWSYSPPHFVSLQRTPLSPPPTTPLLPPPFLPFPPPRSVVLRVAGPDGAKDPALLRRPLVSGTPSVVSDDEDDEGETSAAAEGRGDSPAGKSRQPKRRKADEWVDWEDQILEDTVPLVGFVRMILHSGKYESGDRLIPEHEKTITERLLPYHPEFEKKIGSGIDFITVGFHPEFENSRCMFIVRKDGELVDFSYWKCIKGLIKKKYPLYADSFILRHFKRRKQTQ
ncbi:protein DCL, chloroplastic isoform X1 [Iris pallida]|uniref:Protein DCL, chloroplastic isoform X1 n=1 Tax=Iris pallida TaxID=29817 RepID=A0AAX6I2T8_IRIPA|nr:protein DCL, chloroplastic isoform X1 [Iris pallida]